MTHTSRSHLGSHPLRRSVPPTVAAAVLGNAFIGKDALAWFKGLRRPPLQIPMGASMAVAGVYYASIGTVLYRSAERGDDRSYRLATAVLVGNELWNVALFGRRSTRAGFLGILAFTVPVVLLQRSVAEDGVSALALAPYTAWVVGYDIPWAYQLWRWNP